MFDCNASNSTNIERSIIIGARWSTIGTARGTFCTCVPWQYPRRSAPIAAFAVSVVRIWICQTFLRRLCSPSGPSRGRRSWRCSFWWHWIAQRALLWADCAKFYMFRTEWPALWTIRWGWMCSKRKWFYRRSRATSSAHPKNDTRPLRLQVMFGSADWLRARSRVLRTWKRRKSSHWNWIAIYYRILFIST